MQRQVKRRGVAVAVRDGLHVARSNRLRRRREISGRGRAALVPVGVGLEFAADGEQGVFRKRGAHQLEGDGHVFGEAAGSTRRGSPARLPMGMMERKPGSLGGVPPAPRSRG